MARVLITIPDKLLRAIDRKAKAEYESRSSYIRELAREELKDNPAVGRWVDKTRDVGQDDTMKLREKRPQKLAVASTKRKEGLRRLKRLGSSITQSWRGTRDLQAVMADLRGR